MSADEPHFQRWAVLPAPEVAATGLSDLLTAELSQRKFDLVEREQLAAITKEVELSKLLSPEGSAQRLKVGQLAKADALVLLSLVEHDKKKFLKVVISESRYGSRLRLEHFPFAADRADKLAVEIAQVVAETRTKFARGVERIVAVSPLLSKNVTREFDHLQFAFAALLSQSLAQHPGVAVLEIEEARSIGEELTRSASKLEKQQVPLFVEGEFEITPTADASTEPGGLGTIQFALRVLDGSAERETFTNRAKGRTEAVDWLTKSLPARLLRREGKELAATPLNRVQQQGLLARQAEMFSRVAGYPESTALHEAVLLLEPDDWKQRVQLVTDHLRWWRLREGQSIAIGKGLPSIWSKELRLHVDVVMSNVELVLAQRVLNVGEAGTLLHFAMANFHGRLQESNAPDGARDEQLDYYKRCLKRIALLDTKTRNGQVDGVIVGLYGGSAATDSKSAQSQLVQWIGRAFFTTIQVLPSRSRPGDPHVLADVEHLFVEVVPKEQLAQCVLYSQFRKVSDVPMLVTLRHASAKDVVALYERLRATEEPVLQFYARFGLLGLKTSGVLQEPVGADDLKEADELEQFLNEWSRRSPENAMAVAAVRVPFKEFRGELEKMFSAGGLRKTVPLTPNPRWWTGGDEGLKHLADLHELRRLYFVRTPITNAGLKQLRQLESLRCLRIEETQVTDAGLNALPELPELTELRLEGTVTGHEFGDDSLPQLDRMPALQSLIVYGKSFTDRGLPQLKNQPSLHSVYLLSTSVSQEALKTFKSQSPNIRVELDLPQ